jgi:hypothetical protein
VRVNNRVSSLDAVASCSSVDLLDTRVCGLQAVQTLLEERAKSLISLNGVNEDGVAASLGLVQDVQESGSGRLLLVRNVRVPSDRAGSGLEVVQVALVVDTTVDKVNLGIVLRRLRDQQSPGLGRRRPFAWQRSEPARPCQHR